jgi:hypothetical protein
MADNDLPYRVVRVEPYDVIARAANLLVGRAAYETARRMYPRERVDYRNGAQILARSDQESRLDDLA